METIVLLILLGILGLALQYLIIRVAVQHALHEHYVWKTLHGVDQKDLED